MTRYFCHEQSRYPDSRDARGECPAGAVLLAQSPFHPGGGGQLADRGILRWSGGEVAVTGIEATPEGFWHLLADPVELPGPWRPWWIRASAP